MLQSSEKSIKMSVKYDERSQPLFKICCIFSDIPVLALNFVPFCSVLRTLEYNTKQKEECKLQKTSQTGVDSSLLNGIYICHILKIILLNMHVQLSSGSRYLLFDLPFKSHAGSGKTVQMCRLICQPSLVTYVICNKLYG